MIQTLRMSLGCACSLSPEVLTGEPLVLIAVSNAVAVAAEIALLHKPLAMWFASGVPAEVTTSVVALQCMDLTAMSVVSTGRSDSMRHGRWVSRARCSTS